jgi:hypothetical protein
MQISSSGRRVQIYKSVGAKTEIKGLKPNYFSTTLDRRLISRKERGSFEKLPRLTGTWLV